MDYYASSDSHLERAHEGTLQPHEVAGWLIEDLGVNAEKATFDKWSGGTCVLASEKEESRIVIQTKAHRAGYGDKEGAVPGVRAASAKARPQGQKLETTRGTAMKSPLGSRRIIIAGNDATNGGCYPQPYVHRGRRCNPPAAETTAAARQNKHIASAQPARPGSCAVPP
ncbi:hypothetical protein V5799_009922 [Amblyomma americanum]|uniref:Uncharacterized protein n=1 Tax=Amblyomma americanum TaxID=6943 RepID=A0AAQ4FA85_AMBAM